MGSRAGLTGRGIGSTGTPRHLASHYIPPITATFFLYLDHVFAKRKMDTDACKIVCCILLLFIFLINVPR